MNGIAHDYHRTCLKRPRKICKGLDALSDLFIGMYQRRSSRLRKLDEKASKVEVLAKDLVDLTEEKLTDRMEKVRYEIRRHCMKPGDYLIDAFAISYEVVRREMGLTPHHVQVMGALALGHGYLAEMATGEGKTLTVSLWTAVAGWGGYPCHVITANDYLAARDAEIMSPVYQRCGLRVCSVTGEMGPEERQEAYQADIVYTTSKDLLADFLKDRIALGKLANPDQRLVHHLASRALPKNRLILRGLHTAIVDEADNVMIDEAVIPLRISQSYTNEALREAYTVANGMVKELKEDVDYTCNRQLSEVKLTDEGVHKVSQMNVSLPSLWRGKRRSRELIEQSLVAKELFHKDKQYVVGDDGIMIVDGFSGRVMPDRTWSQGLHQAIEAKEQVDLSDPTETLASLSFQRFFRFFKRLSGLSGTAAEAASEFWQIYRLPVIKIPTHKPCIRKEVKDVLFPSKDEKWEHLIDKARQLHEQKKPILIGTQNVKDSEHIAELMQRENLAFQLLNAVRSESEAEIVAQAGQVGMITIATNMAGRGTDIKLDQEVQKIGGLHVLASERHESKRIDRQLYGRAGRHGDPGFAQAFISLEDELFQKYGPKVLSGMLKWLLRSKSRLANWLARMCYVIAQKNAERASFFLRKQVIQSDAQTEEALSFAGKGL